MQKIKNSITFEIMFDRNRDSNYNNYKAMMPEIGKDAVNMKATGIVRKVDELGRIVLPIELRRTLDIEERDALEIYLDEDRIVLQKYEPACLFCGSNHGLVSYKGKNVCAGCAKELARH